ncbi:hypothetical protein MBLNU457_7687t1 [Dothideomycetes sp. NU457]
MSDVADAINPPGPCREHPPERDPLNPTIRQRVFQRLRQFVFWLLRQTIGYRPPPIAWRERDFSIVGRDHVLNLEAMAPDWDGNSLPDCRGELDLRILRRLNDGQEQIVYVHIQGDGIIASKDRTYAPYVFRGLTALKIWQDTTWRVLELRPQNGTVSITTDRILPHRVPSHLLLDSIPRYNVLDLDNFQGIHSGGWAHGTKAWLNGSLYIFKYRPWDFLLQSIAHEILMYHELMKRGFTSAPALKAYIYEEDPSRVVGFLIEFIEGRHAMIEDYDICKDALIQLHEHGIYHGDAHGRNILITPSGMITFIDFESSLASARRGIMREIGREEEELKTLMKQELDDFYEKLSNNSIGYYYDQ